MKKLLKIKTLAICAILLAGIIFPTILTAQRSDGFFKSDDEGLYENRPSYDLSATFTLGGAQGENPMPAPVGSGLSIMVVMGAAYAVLRRKYSYKSFMSHSAYILLLFVFMFGLTQCKKKVIITDTTEGEGMYITLDAGFGSAKTDFNSENYTFSWTKGATEYIYVGRSTSPGLQSISGDVNSQGNVTFSGTLSTTPSTLSDLYFFYLGKENERHINTRLTIDFTDQSGNKDDVTKYHIACGSAPVNTITNPDNGTISLSSNHHYETNLAMKMSIAFFDLNDFGAEGDEVRIYGDSIYTMAIINSEQGTISGCTKGSIKTQIINTGNYIALIPSTVIDKATTVYFASQSTIGEITFIKGIKEGKYYSNNGQALKPTNTHENDSEEGLLPGKFTVSGTDNPTKKVRFSQGNLQYQASTEHWRFATHQWDYVGDNTIGTVSEGGIKCNNSLIASDYAGWIDLFGWGTSGFHNNNDGNNLSHYPYSSSNTAGEYGPYNTGEWDKALTGTSADYDWGVFNAIQNGGYVPNKWRLLTNDEWNNLLSRQTGITINNVGNACYSFATINTDANVSVKGIIIFPDNYEILGGTNEVTGVVWGDINSNVNLDGTIRTVCTETGFANLQGYGCVFLPETGYRNPGKNNITMTITYYWSSTNKPTTNGYCIYINDRLFKNQSVNRARGCSVRLVRDAAN